MARGVSSLPEAMNVGAEIEDLDIHDLNQAVGLADNDDIKFVFGNLTAASHNHLRVFYGHLKDLGQAYEARFISAAELETILKERPGPGNGRFNGRAGRGRGRWSGAGLQGSQARPLRGVAFVSSRSELEPATGLWG